MAIVQKSNQSGGQLGAANVSQIILKANPNRTGLTFVNPNAAAILLIAFNNDLPPQYCVPLEPNEKWVMDAVTPGDMVYIQSATPGAIYIYVEVQGVQQ